MKKHSIIVALLIVTLLLPAAQCDLLGPGEPSELVIGVMYPLTGSLAVSGQLSLHGVEIARDMVNEQGGVLGKKVVLEVVDAPDPASATAQAERLITEKHVPIILGTYGSSNALAASAVAERHKVVWADTGTMSADLCRRGHLYTFRATANTDTVGFSAAEYMVDLVAPKLGMDPKDIRIAIIHEDSAFGTSIMEAFEKRAKELGLNVVLREPYSYSTTDLAPLVLKLKEAKPDVIMATQYINDEILFSKQAKELDLNFKAFSGSGGMVGVPAFYEAVGADTEGLLEVDGPSTDINQKSLNPDQQALVQDFLKRYKEITGSEQPPSSTLNGFLAAHLLFTKVLPKAGEVDPDKIRDAYLSLDLPEGSTPQGFGVKFDAGGQNERTWMIVRQWQNGKFVAVAPAKWAISEICCIPLKPWSER